MLPIERPVRWVTTGIWPARVRAISAESTTGPVQLSPLGPTSTGSAASAALAASRVATAVERSPRATAFAKPGGVGKVLRVHHQRRRVRRHPIRQHARREREVDPRPVFERRRETAVEDDRRRNHPGEDRCPDRAEQCTIEREPHDSLYSIL